MRVFLALLFCCVLLTSAGAQVTSGDARPTSAAAPRTSAGAQDEPLHVGDAIQISVWQDPKLDRRVVVGPDGMISFPLAGHLQAGGLTPLALENALRGRLQKNYTGHLDITVSLAAINRDEEAETKPNVYITGEVLRPGPYVIRRNTNIMQALAQAGGLGPFAASQRIQIHRQVGESETTFLFNYKAYQSGANTADNISLRSGDVIIVPERGLLE